MPREAEAAALAKTIAGNEAIGAIPYALSGRVLKRNLLIALVVGTLLTLANQFEVILRGPGSRWSVSEDLSQLCDSFCGFIGQRIREPMRPLEFVWANKRRSSN